MDLLGAKGKKSKKKTDEGSIVDSGATRSIRGKKSKGKAKKKLSRSKSGDSKKE